MILFNPLFIILLVGVIILFPTYFKFKIKEYQWRKKYGKFMKQVQQIIYKYFPGELKVSNPLWDAGSNDFRRIYQSTNYWPVTNQFKLNGVKIYVNPLYKHQMKLYKKPYASKAPDLTIIIHQKLPREFNEEIRKIGYEIISKERLINEQKDFNNLIQENSILSQLKNITQVNKGLTKINKVQELLIKNVVNLQDITIINKKSIQNQDNPETLANELYYVFNLIKRFTTQAHYKSK